MSGLNKASLIVTVGAQEINRRRNNRTTIETHKIKDESFIAGMTD